MDLQTLPSLCQRWGESLDVARELLRRRPDLAMLAKRFGPTRLFDAEAAERIKQALAERRGPVHAG
jgi:hypothetical protein